MDAEIRGKREVRREPVILQMSKRDGNTEFRNEGWISKKYLQLTNNNKRNPSESQDTLFVSK